MKALLRLLVVLAAIGGASAVLHATAASALAECPPSTINADFAVDVARARAAAIGNIATFGRDAAGAMVVKSVYVDWGFRIPRSNIHGTFRPGSCLEPWPKLGTRIIVLLGVQVAGSTKRVDRYYTIGVSVSADVAARAGADLPDTDVAVSSPGPGTPAQWPLVVAGVLGFGLVWARIRRAGALQRRRRPRRRAASGRSARDSRASPPRGGRGRRRGAPG